MEFKTYMQNMDVFKTFQGLKLSDLRLFKTFYDPAETLY